MTETLGALGYDVHVVEDGSPELLDVEVVWLVGSANWFPESLRLLSVAAARPRVVLWHIEPLPLARAHGLAPSRLSAREVAKILLRDPRRTDPRSNFRTLQDVLARGLVDIVAVSASERQEFLAEQGIASHFFPLGYRASNHGRDLGLERDIDVLFLGSLEVPRRVRILRRLRREGVEVHAHGDWFDQRFWGEERSRLLNRTKILLNIPRHAGMLSGQRMLLGMANKALVVAEPIVEPMPYVPGTHYVSASLDEMATEIRSWVVDDESRRTITDAAYEFVTSQLTMERSVAGIAALVEEP